MTDLNGRDREMRLELKNASKQEVISSLEHFLGSQKSGRIGFEKEGEAFSVWATSEIEPITS
jgi:hypothetical protein